jgi:hypothetical protein
MTDYMMDVEEVKATGGQEPLKIQQPTFGPILPSGSTWHAGDWRGGQLWPGQEVGTGSAAAHQHNWKSFEQAIPPPRATLPLPTASATYTSSQQFQGQGPQGKLEQTAAAKTGTGASAMEVTAMETYTSEATNTQGLGSSLAASFQSATAAPIQGKGYAPAAVHPPANLSELQMDMVKEMSHQCP